jgi:hypothetical protein
LLVFHAYINEMHGSRSKILNKKSRPYNYDVKFLAFLGAPYIYDFSRLRVKPKVYKLPRPWSLWGSFLARENSHGRTWNRTRDLLWLPSHEAGLILRIKMLNCLYQRSSTVGYCTIIPHLPDGLNDWQSLFKNQLQCFYVWKCLCVVPANDAFCMPTWWFSYSTNAIKISS